MDDATTPIPEETTTEASTDTGTTEADNTEGRAEVAPEVDVLSSIADEAVRTQVADYIAEKEKGFKADFTRKSMEYGESTSAKDTELTNARSQYDQLVGEVKEVLNNPAKFEAYQKLYGDANAGALPPKEFETVEDLNKYWEQRMSAEVEAASKKIEAQFTNRMSDSQQEQRWASSVKELRSEDPVFAKWERVIVKLATEDKYKNGFAPGNEGKVLRGALDEFKAMRREDLENFQTQAKKDIVERKEAATQVPPAPAQTTQPAEYSGKFSSPLEDPNEVNALIRAVNAKYPEWGFRK